MHITKNIFGPASSNILFWPSSGKHFEESRNTNIGQLLNKKNLVSPSWQNG